MIHTPPPEPAAEPLEGRATALHAVLAPEQQIGIALADTPNGQRLAITITCLLPAEHAKQLAAAITQAAAAMSTTGLVIAGSIG